MYACIPGWQKNIAFAPGVTYQWYMNLHVFTCLWWLENIILGDAKIGSYYNPNKVRYKKSLHAHTEIHSLPHMRHSLNKVYIYTTHIYLHQYYINI